LKRTDFLAAPCAVAGDPRLDARTAHTAELSGRMRRVDTLLREQIVTRTIGVLGALLAIAVSAHAQSTETTAANSPDQSVQAPQPPGAGVTFTLPNNEFSGGWVPLGPAPVDQAGAGRRGYVLPGDGGITAAGKTQISLHSVAANNFYREENREFLITQRYETHTIGLDVRRGFKPAGFPHFEIGGQLQLHESDGGMLNGFITGIENFWSSVTGYEDSRNQLRGAGAKSPPLGTVITRNGSTLYRDPGNGSGIGDLYGVAKIALLDPDPASRSPHVAARIGVNVAGRSSFTEGNYIGGGLSIDHKWLEGLAFHLDVRATRVLDRMSVWNLGLRRMTYAFSAGPEFKLGKNSSVNLQMDGSSTPYFPTGTLAFDKSYGAITFGVGHRFGQATAQIYVRENMNLPLTVRWNTDPDMSLGLKVRIH
jgi:hypothetical protein